MHALIIEQDTWIILMIEDALRDLGFTSFDIADCRQDAEALSKKRCPDLITSDVRLGTSNGIDTVRAICSARDIPVVFITATSWEARARSPGAPVVQKPFQPAVLKEAVRVLISSPPSS